MTHDRIHARKPTVDPERWREGLVRDIETADGHAVFTVETAANAERVELTVTTAVRDLVCSRLDLADGADPVGERVWFRQWGE